MPKVKKGETKSNFISRCVQTIIKEGKTQKQALGQCYGLYDNYLNKKRQRSRKKAKRYPRKGIRK